MMFATTLVMLQTPASGLVQAGAVRRKSTLSMFTQVMAGSAIGYVLAGHAQPGHLLARFGSSLQVQDWSGATEVHTRASTLQSPPLAGTTGPSCGCSLASQQCMARA